MCKDDEKHSEFSHGHFSIFQKYQIDFKKFSLSPFFFQWCSCTGGCGELLCTHAKFTVYQYFSSTSYTPVVLERYQNFNSRKTINYGRTVTKLLNCPESSFLICEIKTLVLMEKQAKNINKQFKKYKFKWPINKILSLTMTKDN